MELDPRIARSVLEPNLATCNLTRAASVHVMVRLPGAARVCVHACLLADLTVCRSSIGMMLSEHLCQDVCWSGGR